MIRSIQYSPIKPVLNTYKASPKVGFSAMPDPKSYDAVYSHSNSYNGKTPDEKIMDTITKRFPDPKNITIVDVGAGDGRNTIPLFEKGYNVHSLEFSDDGKCNINQRASVVVDRSQKPMNNKLGTSSHDITKIPLTKKRNAFCISHVTQHLNSDELKTTFSNIENSLKPGGIVIFDALIDKSGKSFENTKKDEKRGWCRFKKEEIQSMAEENGLRLVENTPYKEKESSRPPYIDQKRWGGSGMDYKKQYESLDIPDNLRSLINLITAPQALEEKLAPRRNVKLEWFVFEKPE